MDVKLSTEQLDELKNKFENCLCAVCLDELRNKQNNMSSG
jgi:hypothetical protein